MSRSALAETLSRKRLLIFDLDGTLVDSSPLHARAFAETFAPLGIEVDYSTIAGMTTGSAVEKLLSGAGRDSSETERRALIDAKRALGMRLIGTELEALPGAIEFVEAAGSRWPLALCTSGSRETVTCSLARVGLAGRFAPIVAAEDVKNGKPDPEAFMTALAHYGIPAEEALVFEDSESGLAAAAAAGIEAVKVVPKDPASAGGADWRALNAALEEIAG
jgi:HAD superfamily hydrolase (TIGR01509 family)